jgi:hypothetical protein
MILAFSSLQGQTAEGEWPIQALLWLEWGSRPRLPARAYLSFKKMIATCNTSVTALATITGICFTAIP